VWLPALIGGTVIGITYVLSPLTVWFTIAMVGLVAYVRRNLIGDERRWVTTLVVIAIAARVVAVAVLFVMTNHARVQFGAFFGDEEYFIKRSIWLRNIALGIPIHGADFIYAFDDYSQTSYLYVLAMVQVLVGPSPYGVHLIGVACYLAATVLLFRFVRDTLGPVPARIGLFVLLFMPSLFAWSISALKEPLFLLLMALNLTLTAVLARGVGPWRRTAAAIGIAASAIALETIRSFGAGLTIASIAAGIAIGALAVRPRLMIATFVAVPLLAGAVLSRPSMQLRAYKAISAAAVQHWGHIATAGYVYKLLDDRLYQERSNIDDMHAPEMLRFIVRAMVRYATVPEPWTAQSSAALSFLPEQMVWYVLIAFAPVGALLAFRRDPFAAGLLIAHGALAAVTVALVSGNIGTLVRHRGLAVPYLVWLGAVGLCELASRTRTACQ
jgi:hypothetical protein